MTDAEKIQQFMNTKGVEKHPIGCATGTKNLKRVLNQSAYERVKEERSKGVHRVVSTGDEQAIAS